MVKRPHDAQRNRVVQGVTRRGRPQKKMLKQVQDDKVGV